eukprot:571716-Amphidinium_carterae.1
MEKLGETIEQWERELGRGDEDRSLGVLGPSEHLFLFANKLQTYENVKIALSAALGGVWHEACANAIFNVGDSCVRCGEAVEDLEHI